MADEQKLTVYLVIDMIDDYHHPVVKVLSSHEKARSWAQHKYPSDPEGRWQWWIVAWTVDDPTDSHGEIL